MSKTFHNPILPGFYPDPSICRVGTDYYLVNSSFEYFPGLPLFHSRDLVNWRQIGHVLTLPSQLNLDGIAPSRGLYAPTLRYHQAIFYVVNTLVEGCGKTGNFVVTATNITGPWSEPVWLDGAPGIDPSLFFDDDGRAWFTGTRQLDEAGHCEIWLQEFNLHTLQLTGPVTGLTTGALVNATWAESPHLYKINGWYYLMIAEGGTYHNHAITIFRSKQIDGPYENCARNPILTHRHLGSNYPVVCTGHADLVETPNGDWWMVLLAARPYGGYFYNLGRETFLTPVVWEDGWPVVNPGYGCITLESATPALAEHRWPAMPVRDDFTDTSLALSWNFLRTVRTDWYSLKKRASHLRLRLRPEMITDLVNPSFVGRRQQHINFCVRASLEFTPRATHECAGLVLLQNNDFQFRLVVTIEQSPVIRLIRRSQGIDAVIAQHAVELGLICLKVAAVGQAYSFYCGADEQHWIALALAVDGRILSTPVAGGFVGAYIGMYASSNGLTSDNVADWDWFDYEGW